MPITLSGSSGISSPGFTPTGNTSPVSGINLLSANTISLVTSSSDRVIVDSLGRVGLGTSSMSNGYSGSSNQTINLKNQASILWQNTTGGWSTTTSGAAITYWTDSGLYIDAKDSSSNMYFRVNGDTTRLQIDSSGRIKTPYQPFLFGRISGAAANYQTMTVQQSRNASVSTANGVTNSRYTAQVAGVYSLKMNVIFNQDSSRRDITWRKNGGNLVSSLSEDSTTGFHYRSISIDTYLNVNDYVEIYNISSGIVYNGGSWDTEWTSFSITFVG